MEDWQNIWSEIIELLIIITGQMSSRWEYFLSIGSKPSCKWPSQCRYLIKSIVWNFYTIKLVFFAPYNFKEVQLSCTQLYCYELYTGSWGLACSISIIAWTISQQQKITKCDFHCIIVSFKWKMTSMIWFELVWNNWAGKFIRETEAIPWWDGCQVGMFWVMVMLDNEASIA